MNEAAPSRLILVRHGETTGESSIRLNGRTDVPLSELGRRQGTRVGEVLAGTEVDRLVVSPLVRSREMASLAWPSPHPPQEVVAGFLEIDFGDWETLTVGEVEARDPQGFHLWENSRDDFTYPGGESVPGFRQRISQAARETFRGSPGTTLAVLHKGVIKGILAALLERSPETLREYSVELGSIHRLEYGPQGWSLTSPGEVGHLGDDRSPEASLPGSVSRSEEPPEEPPGGEFSCR